MPTFHYESVISSCSSAELYAFHCDPANLPLITPKHTRVRIISMNVPLQEGSRIVLAITRGFITLTWKLRIETMLENRLMVDVAEQSPFQSFRHEHAFIPLENGRTALRDVITLEMPWGNPGRLFLPLIRRDLDAMFAYRHLQTQRHFETRNQTT